MDRAARRGDALRIEEGSLYPALHRLERKGMMDAEWGLSEKNRKVKYYQLAFHIEAMERELDRRVPVRGVSSPTRVARLARASSVTFHKHRRIRMVARSVVLIIGVAVASGCKGREQSRPADSTASAPNVVALSATEYAISAPDSIPAGWTTFRLANRGEQVHYGHIVRLDDGRTPQDLVGAYAEAIRTSAPRPAWVKRFGGPGGTAPGDSSNVTQQLEPGSYVWICPVEDDSGTPHFTKGEVRPFVVYAVAANAAVRASAPASDATIRLADFSFTVASPLKAGRHTIRVENAGAEPHDVALLKLAAGRTIEEVRTWLNPELARRSGDTKDPPPLETIGSVAGGIAAISPGMSAYFEANLTPGEYVLFCMVTAPDGRSHIEHGMIQRLRIE